MPKLRQTRLTEETARHQLIRFEPRIIPKAFGAVLPLHHGVLARFFSVQSLE